MFTNAGCPRVGRGLHRSFAASYNENNVKYQTWRSYNLCKTGGGGRDDDFEVLFLGGGGPSKH